MTLRYAKTAIAGIAAATLIAGCGLVQGDSEAKATPTAPQSSTGGQQVAGPTTPPQLPSAGTTKSQRGLAATVNWFKADGQGYGTLLVTVENTSPNAVPLSDVFRDQDGRTHATQAGGLQIRDDAKKEIQGTLGDTERNCVCTVVPPGSEYYQLNQGDKMTVYSTYPISNETATITVMLPGFAPVPNVQVDRP